MRSGIPPRGSGDGHPGDSGDGLFDILHPFDHLGLTHKVDIFDERVIFLPERHLGYCLSTDSTIEVLSLFSGPGQVMTCRLEGSILSELGVSSWPILLKNSSKTHMQRTEQDSFFSII